MPNHIDWTPSMDQVLVDIKARDTNLTQIARDLNICRKSLIHRMINLDLPIPSKEWTLQEDEILRENWEKGLSSRSIGEIMGRTRNSVIGRSHRLKLSERAISRPKKVKVPKEERPPRIRKRELGKKEMIAPKKASPPRFYPAAVPLTTKPPISIMELGMFTCRAIVGRGPDGLAVYCGDMTFYDKSFCEGHCAMYYRPPDYRRRG